MLTPLPPFGNSLHFEFSLGFFPNQGPLKFGWPRLTTRIFNLYCLEYFIFTYCILYLVFWTYFLRQSCCQGHNLTKTGKQYIHPRNLYNLYPAVLTWQVICCFYTCEEGHKLINPQTNKHTNGFNRSKGCNIEAA